MNKLKDLFKRIPWYGYVFAIILFGYQFGIYRFAYWLAHVIGSFDHVIIPKIEIIDDSIPLIPCFSVIYLFSYVFWICGSIAISLTKKENFINYIVGYFIAITIGSLFLIFMPTTMSRVEEGLFEQVAKPGIFNKLLGVIYENDGKNYNINLFPSYHCLISIYCYFGIRKQTEIKKSFKIYTIVMAILIILSTVFTKQHYFIDILGGLGLATISYFIIEIINPGKRILEKEKIKNRVYN